MTLCVKEMYNKLRLLFAGGSERSVRVKKNIVASAIMKILDMIVHLALVPLTLGYLNAYEYGIWLTLSSVLIWIDSFDIGLGNGLRNNLAIALAHDDKEKARGLVSTTAFMLLAIVVVIFLVFSIVSLFVDWYSLLNVNREVVCNLGNVVYYTFIFFCLNFSLRFIGNIYQAQQMPSVNSLMNLCAHTFSLIVIFFLTKTVPGELLYVALAYSAATPLVYLLCYPITFRKLYPFLSPSVSFFKKEYLKVLMSQGVLFFLLQLTGIVFFSLTNLIISNLFGPDQVTSYNISYKYFSVVLIVFNMLMGPIWSAATNAYALGEMDWIKNTLNKLLNIFILFVAGVIVMIILSNEVYHLWVGDEVVIPITMSLLMGFYVLIIQYSSIYSSILYGIGKLRILTISSIVYAIIFYPLCIGLSKPFGVTGVLMGMCLIHLSGAVLNTIQLKKLINNTATGIWSK